jgi:hypothetical protein
MRKLLSSMPIVLIVALLTLMRTRDASASGQMTYLTSGQSIFAPVSSLANGVVVAGCNYLPDGTQITAYLYLGGGPGYGGYEYFYGPGEPAGPSTSFLCDGFGGAAFYHLPCATGSGPVTYVHGFICYGDPPDPYFGNCTDAKANVTGGC